MYYEYNEDIDLLIFKFYILLHYVMLFDVNLKWFGGKKGLYKYIF